ncbi:MAG: MFS transporter, partial [Candidatus Omnitrophica bacterium]|nr:MFS transporter [Candidatus Omnitrophota bacterium]
METQAKPSIWEGVTPYHVLVLIIASCGWLFDCMDQRIFVLGRESALKELLTGQGGDVTHELKPYIGWATMWMIFGWATGGIIFGSLSDKIGRVKTMVLTLFVYSGFTGLSAFSQNTLDFTIYRFLVGLGIGGMFGSAAALVAESVPTGIRSLALGSLQALSATGNILGSLISLWLPPGLMVTLMGWELAGWRALFLVGILPSLLVIPIVLFLREPEPWKLARQAALTGEKKHQLGKIPDLFSHPRWRHHTLVGLALGVSGMIGLWGIGFYTPELVTAALQGESQA